MIKREPLIIGDGSPCGFIEIRTLDDVQGIMRRFPRGYEIAIYLEDNKWGQDGEAAPTILVKTIEGCSCVAPHPVDTMSTKRYTDILDTVDRMRKREEGGDHEQQ